MTRSQKYDSSLEEEIKKVIAKGVRDLPPGEDLFLVARCAVGMFHRKTLSDLFPEKNPGLDTALKALRGYGSERMLTTWLPKVRDKILDGTA